MSHNDPAEQPQQQDSEPEPSDPDDYRPAGTPSTSGRAAHEVESSSLHDQEGRDTPRSASLRRQGSARLGRTQKPSGVRKARGPHNTGKSASAPVREPGPTRQALREHQSGPAGVSPAMVALNSIRTGVLSGDRQVREKIAAAAQRVLAARGLQRRRSSEVRQRMATMIHRPPTPRASENRPINEAAQAMSQRLSASASAPSFTSLPAALQTSTSGGLLELAGASEQQPQPPSSVFTPHTERPRERLSVSASPSMPHLPIVNVGATGPQPISLATATALARGEALSMSPSSGLANLPSTTANFHRPALRPAVAAGGSGASLGYRPFVVTTGTPRFAPEPPTRPAWQSTPSPLRTQPLGSEPSGNFQPGMGAEALLTLADLSSSHGPESSTYG
jgi:hypothetical protein